MYIYKISLERMAKGGKVGKDSIRVLGKRARARGRKGGQCRRRSYGDGISMVLGVGENLLVGK